MNIEYEHVVITGVAGFIGFHVAKKVLDEGKHVLGIDNLNDYYDVDLKKSRLHMLSSYERFDFFQNDISDKAALDQVFKQAQVDVVVNLAAQAGVRYSLINPQAYVDSNISGFVNILEACRHHGIRHLVFASSSSVYGSNRNMPFSVHQNVDHPVSLYAASKKANELMAHSYSHLFDLPCTGLRFFTVYGPWGRPDMALFLFTKAILDNKPIDVFNFGKMKRDFTYIDDIVEGVVRVMKKSPDGNPDWDGRKPDPGSSYAKYKVYNIGNNKPVELDEFIRIIEDALGKEAKKNYKELQPGDVVETYANIDDLENDFGFTPRTDLRKGIRNFIFWYKSYYGTHHQ